MSDDERRKDLGHAHPLELVFEFLAQYFFLGTILVLIILIPTVFLTELTFALVFERELEFADYFSRDVVPWAAGYWVVSFLAWLVFTEDGREAVGDAVRLFSRISASRVVRRQRRDSVRTEIARRSGESGGAAARDLSEQASRAGEAARRIRWIYAVMCFSCLSLLSILGVLVVAVMHFGGEVGFWIAGIGGFVYFVLTAIALEDLSRRAAELSTLQLERYEALHASEALIERGQAQAGSLSIAGDGVEGGLSVVDGSSSVGE